MRSSSFGALALLLVQAVVFSGCGNHSSRSEDEAEGAASVAAPVYTYKDEDNTWAQLPEIDKTDPGPTKDGGEKPKDKPVDKPRVIVDTTAIGRIERFCQTVGCRFIRKLPERIPVLPIEWKRPIPRPYPDPAPIIRSHVIYQTKVFEVTGVASKTKIPALLVRQIGDLAWK